MTPLQALIRPGVDVAVDRAIHDLDPGKFHERLPYGSKCPLCPTIWDRMNEKLAKALEPQKEKILARMGEIAQQQMEADE